jgi:hypothetical protein
MAHPFGRFNKKPESGKAHFELNNKLKAIGSISVSRFTITPKNQKNPLRINMNSHISTILASQPNLRHLNLKIKGFIEQVYAQIASLDFKSLTMQMLLDVKDELRFVFRLFNLETITLLGKHFLQQILLSVNRNEAVEKDISLWD